eukprot:2630096-Karenia_brevis.AAC.2
MSITMVHPVASSKSTNYPLYDKLVCDLCRRSKLNVSTASQVPTCMKEGNLVLHVLWNLQQNSF